MVAPNPNQMIVVGMTVKLMANGNVVVEATSDSPRKPNLDDIHGIGTKMIRDVEIELMAEAVIKKQMSMVNMAASHMREQQQQAKDGPSRPANKPSGKKPYREGDDPPDTELGQTPEVPE